MFACFVFYCSLLILYFICIFLLLLPTWRIKLMKLMMMINFAAYVYVRDASRPDTDLAEILFIDCREHCRRLAFWC